MKVYIHGGFHKTATSSIQKLLADNAPLAPSGYRFYVYREHTLVRDLYKRLLFYWRVPSSLALKRVRTGLERLREEMVSQQTQTAIVSLESLCGQLPNHRNSASIYPHANTILKEVADVFAADEPVFMFSTRNVRSWIESLYYYRVRSRGTRMKLEEFAAVAKYRTLDWDNLVDEVMKDIEAPRHVVAMEDDLKSPLGPGSTILSIISPDGELTANWKPVERLKPKPDSRVLELGERWWMMLLPRFLRRRIMRTYMRWLKRSDGTATLKERST